MKKREYEKNRYHNMSEEKKDWKNIKKIVVKLKGLNIIINIFYGFNSVCDDLIMSY